MNVTLRILRQNGPDTEAYWEEIPYSCDNENETVATALTRLNEALEQPVRWECSCLQKKCGACAMVINGRPALACDSFLRDLSGRKGIITLEPLHKFPVVADLMVDRSVLYEHLQEMRQWVTEPVETGREQNGTAYEASRCLQCGCCLEVCPNVCPGGGFYGAAAFVPASRVISEEPARARKELTAAYRKYVYAGCGKSLSCRDICPAGIDIEHLLSRSNAAAVWRLRKQEYPTTADKWHP